MRIFAIIGIGVALLAAGCGGAAKGASAGEGTRAGEAQAQSAEAAQLFFSGDSAMAYASRQVEFGPRVPGSASHARTAAWLASELRRHGAKVTEQRATLTAFDGTKLPAVNILGSYNPQASRRLMVVAHWDTRPWADQDPDPAKRRQPVDGADDGASGTALLLELARVSNGKLPDGQGLDILLVDAEDWGREDDEESWAMGTRHFVANPPEGWRRPEAAVVVDMVGDADATFYREYFSEQSAPALNSRVWNLASALGYGSMFIDAPGGAVTDDHVELIKAGIPAIDIIDYRPGSTGFPPQWHTSSDTPDRLSPSTLEAVGRTLERLLQVY